MISAITFAEWILGVGFFVSTFGFIVILYRWKVEMAEKREGQRHLELSKKEAAELKAEMREIQRRGRAPDLRPYALHVPKFNEKLCRAVLTPRNGPERSTVQSFIHHGPTTKQVHQTQTPGCLSQAQEGASEGGQEEVVRSRPRVRVVDGSDSSGPFLLFAESLAPCRPV